jgi:CRISPR-associated endonuclease/helicase Cas3
MDSNKLWAKKPFFGSAPSVVEHCSDVRDAAEMVWKLTASDLAAALGPSCSIGDMASHLLAATTLHDFGKVNSAFQQMLQTHGTRQPVRHEIVAAWLLTDDAVLGRWFQTLGPVEAVWPIIWAIAGHHLKMSDPKHAGKPGQPPPLFVLGDTPDEVTIPLAAVESLFRDAMTALGPNQALPPLGELRFRTLDNLEQRIDDYVDASIRAWTKLGKAREVKLRTAVLKAFLIAADVAASALERTGRRPVDWIPEALGTRIEARTLDSVIAKGTKGQEPLEFQKQVGTAASAAVVIAGCGNGKTTAAYLWARRHAVGRKLWFTYPTTGTASVGFEDYVFRQPELQVVLIHGRSKVDLVAMQGTKEDDRDEEALRLESLESWKSQAIVCTVDTVLGLLQNQRRPLFSFPALAAGAFVFDEIHSYDARMFGCLLRFLKTFPGLPVLLMSASIPPARLVAIKATLGDRAGDEIRGDPALEGYKRYHLEPGASAEACQESVKAKLTEKKKVLWVCNTVGDAIRIAQEARTWAGVEPIVYHSRFRYRDRVNRQQELIRAFKSPGAVLAVTTQVCEMSLDISADLLVTAECPLPSLVQRLGRLNRYATADDPGLCLVYPFTGDPYNEDPKHAATRGNFRVEMQATRTTVAELGGRPCSQKDLAERLDAMFVDEEFEEGSAWLDGGWVTVPAHVRDAGASVTVVREEDLAAVEAELGPGHAKPARWSFQSLVPWSIPMNSPGRLRTNRPPAGGYPVAAAGTIAYCEKEGATWQTNAN